MMSELEKEFQAYCRLMQSAREQKAALEHDHNLAAEWRDEMDVMMLYSDWPLLKRRCAQAIAAVAAQQVPAA